MKRTRTLRRRPSRPQGEIARAGGRPGSHGLRTRAACHCRVLEYRINRGFGYRATSADGDVLVILLVGGTKVWQSRDIQAAKER
jgi:putative addiction module killer protein